MASVYLGQLPGPHGFEKWVALKVIHPHMANNRRFVRMFLDEARIAARINHPHVCSVIDFGEDEERDLPFLVMEYLHGETLSTVLKRCERSPGPMPWRLAVRIVADAARGLHAAHELKKPNGELLGVVHRDISPQNIFVLYDGLSKVLDFGIARLRERTGDTKSGEIKGKIAYMSPEQFRNEEIDRRSDIWALGVVLWETATGRPLFEVGNQGATVFSILQDDIPPLSKELEGVDEALDAILFKALERDLDARYGTAAELASDLERCLYSGGEPAGPEQVSEWMSEHFVDRLKARSALLQAPPLAGERIAEVDISQASGGGEAVVHAPRSSSLPPPIPADAVVSSSPSKPRSIPRLYMVIGAVALLVTALMLGLLIGRNGGGSSTALAGNDGRAPTKASPLAGGPELDLGQPPAAADAPPAVIDAAAAEADVAAAEADAAAAEADAAADSDEQQRQSQSETRQKQRSGRPSGPPGRLNLMVIPAAEIYSGGRRLGRSPLFNVRMPPGRHRITLRPIGGGASRTIIVRIPAGKAVRRSVRLD